MSKKVTWYVKKMSGHLNGKNFIYSLDDLIPLKVVNFIIHTLLLVIYCIHSMKGSYWIVMLSDTLSGVKVFNYNRKYSISEFPNLLK